MTAQQTRLHPADSNPSGAAWPRLFRSVRSESIDDVQKDALVAGTTLTEIAVDKLNAGIGGGVLTTVLAFAVGLVSGPIGILITLLASGSVAYFLPDADLRKRASNRRNEFAEALNAFVNLVAVSVAGGGGVATAMTDASAIGRGWVFDAIRQALTESRLQGESPWVGLDRLGRQLDVVPLVELAGSLALTGASGAQMTETLLARAESGRQRELADARAEAERRSESMTIPLAVLMLAWMGFIGYPAVSNLLAGGF